MPNSAPLRDRNDTGFERRTRCNLTLGLDTESDREALQRPRPITEGQDTRIEASQDIEDERQQALDAI